MKDNIKEWLKNNTGYWGSDDELLPYPMREDKDKGEKEQQEFLARFTDRPAGEKEEK